jgi:hypothetical protein
MSCSRRGINPQIESGWRGINVTCDKWSTADGLRVGSSMKDVAGLSVFLMRM